MKKRTPTGVYYARWEPGAHDRAWATNACTYFLFALIALTVLNIGDLASFTTLGLGLANLLGAFEVVTPLRQRKQDFASLRDDPCPVPQYDADIVIRCEKVITGIDSGVITFTDGWLVFHGMETSFSLSADQCSPVEAVFDTWWDMTSEARFFQALRIGGTSLDVSFRSRSGRRLRFEMDVWLMARSPVGTSVAPPQLPHRTARAVVRVRTLRAFAKAALASSLLGHLSWNSESAPAVIVAVLGVAIAAGLFVQTVLLLRYVRRADIRLRRFEASSTPAFEPELVKLPASQ